METWLKVRNTYETRQISLFVGLCSLFRPWPCTRHNSCLLRIEELNNRDILFTYVIHAQWMSAKQRIVYVVVDLPTEILASLFASLIFAGLHNHFTLKTMTVMTICTGNLNTETHWATLIWNETKRNYNKSCWSVNLKEMGLFQLSFCHFPCLPTKKITLDPAN